MRRSARCPASAESGGSQSRNPSDDGQQPSRKGAPMQFSNSLKGHLSASDGISDSARAVSVLVALSVLLFLVTAATYSSLGVVLPDMVREMHWNWSEAGLGFTLLGFACGASSWLPRILIRGFGADGTPVGGTGAISGLPPRFVRLRTTPSLL